MVVEELSGQSVAGRAPECGEVEQHGAPGHAGGVKGGIGGGWARWMLWGVWFGGLGCVWGRKVQPQGAAPSAVDGEGEGRLHRNTPRSSILAGDRRDFERHLAVERGQQQAVLGQGTALGLHCDALRSPRDPHRRGGCFGQVFSWPPLHAELAASRRPVERRRERWNGSRRDGHHRHEGHQQHQGGLPVVVQANAGLLGMAPTVLLELD